MDRRTLLAISICFLIFAAWNEFYIKPRTPHQMPITGTTETTSPQTSAVQSGAAPTQEFKTSSKKESQQKSVPFSSEVLKLSTGTALVGNGDKIVTGWN